MTTTPTAIRLKRRRTKIVATVGPASHEPAMLEALIRAGVNVFRLNLSHGDQTDHRTILRAHPARRRTPSANRSPSSPICVVPRSASANSPAAASC